MNERKRAKLRKLLDKWYFSHGQRLTVASIEVRQKDSAELSIYLFDPKTKEFGSFLFDIRNYSSFFDWDIPIYNKFTDDVHEVYKKHLITFDSVRAGCTPRYFEGYITLYKFEGITHDDIRRALEYFIRDVLKEYLLFNLEVYVHEEDEK